MTTKAAASITLRQIRAFVALAREGSFTRAAETLLLTQPALTNCIRQLEEHIGHSLFDRSTRQVRLNDYGLAFRDPAERILRELDQTLQVLDRMQEGASGGVSLATVPSIASSILPQTLAEFSLRYPTLGISLMEDHSEGVRRKVLEGEAEVGLSGQTDAVSGIDAFALFYDDVGLFCHASHPLANLDRPLRWADLAGCEIFNMGYQNQIQAVIDVVPELEITLSQTSYKVRNTLSTISLIRSRNALAALPRLSIPQEAQTDIVFKPLHDPVLRRDVFLCKPSSQALTAPCRALIAIICSAAGAAGAVLHDGVDSVFGEPGR